MFYRLLALLCLAPIVASAGPVEQRCTDLGGVCVASEPLNTNAYNCPGGSCNPGEEIDFGDSEGAGAKEMSSPWAWGSTPGITPVATSVSDVALPTGTSILSWVAKAQGDGQSTVRQMSHNTLANGIGRRCMRVYRKFSSDYRGFNSPTPACGANKQQEFWGGGVQHSESGGGNFILAALSFSIPPYNGNANVPSTGSLRWQDCVDNWCRQEICVSGSDVKTGDGISLSGYARQVGVANPLVKTYTKTLVGDQSAGQLCGAGCWVLTAYRESCTAASDGYFYFTHAMVADWPTDADQFIGAASEVEGSGDVTIKAPFLLP